MTTWAWLVVVGAGALSWTWVLYPLAVWCASRLRRPPAPDATMALPSVTAILATRDDVGTIAARVADFLSADYPRELLHVVVGVDSASGSRLEQIRAACGDAPVVVVAADTPGGKSAGLNAAVRAAEGDVLVFSDAQQRFERDAILRLVRGLQSDAQLGALGGALQLPGDSPGGAGRSPVEWYWCFERWLRAAEARLHSTVGLSGSIYAMWRRDWVVMPDHLILDDVWLPMRLVLAGRRVGYDLDARAWDARRTSAAQEQVRKVRTLTGNFQLVAWLPALLVPLRNPIWVQFVSHKLLRLLTPWLLLACIAGVAGLAWQWVSPTLVPVVLTALAALAAAVLLTPRTRTVAVKTAVWGWSLQVAVVQATANGLRGRWDVWR